MNFKLILLRHGMTMANEQHLYCGATDIPISDRGIAELEALKAECTFPEASVFLTSGMLRADQTLKAIYGKAPDKRLPCFAEMNFGDFEMKSYDQLKEQADYQEWITDIDTNACPNGESQPQFVSRMQQGMDEIFDEYGESGKTVLLVAHGGVIAWAMQHFFPSNKNYYEWQPLNGRGYLASFGDNPNYEAIPLKI